MEVKEKYETPMMEMIGFNREEVVTMSGQGDEIPNENFVDSNDTRLSGGYTTRESAKSDNGDRT